jgi:hypothetical protein
MTAEDRKQPITLSRGALHAQVWGSAGINRLSD